MSNETKNLGSVNEPAKKNLAINPEELLINDEKLVSLIQKGFSDLTEEEYKNFPKFPAKVCKEKLRIGFGKAVEIKEVWKFYLKLSPSVILTRNITDGEIAAIQFLNPDLISDKAKVCIPVKCMSGLTENGRRFFRVIGYLCDSVYYGSSQKDKKNNGFLSNLDVTNLVINNRLAVSDKSLRKVNFITVTKEVSDSLNIENISEDDF